MSRPFTAGLFVGLWVGSLLTSVAGFALTRPAPRTHVTLPRPVHAPPPPVFDVRGEDLIPPQALPVPERP